MFHSLAETPQNTMSCDSSIYKSRLAPSLPILILQLELSSTRQIRSITSPTNNLQLISIHLNPLKRITSIQQINLPPLPLPIQLISLQTPLCSLKHTHPRPPKTSKPHRSLILLSHNL